jgi:general secretion pathway protein C
VSATTAHAKTRQWLARGAWIAPLELLLVALLGVALAHLTWTLFAPPATGSSAAEAVLQAGAGPSSVAKNLFGAAGAPQRAPSAAGARVRLIGVVAPGTPEGGVAIFAVEGSKARSVAAGEAVAPGAILKEVHPDHVILTRQGADERIALERRAASPNAAR